MSRVQRLLVVRSLGVYRACGSGVRECVVYWVAETRSTAVAEVVGVVHPAHRASGFDYAVDGAWLTRFFLRRAERAQCLVAQVHTHPGPRTDHSFIDDQFVVVPSPGFVSIVVPNFGLEPLDIPSWNVQVLERAGTWQSCPELIQWS
jgi:hypothetical protein